MRPTRPGIQYETILFSAYRFESFRPDSIPFYLAPNSKSET